VRSVHAVLPTRMLLLLLFLIRDYDATRTCETAMYGVLRALQVSGLQQEAAELREQLRQQSAAGVAAVAAAAAAATAAEVHGSPPALGTSPAVARAGVAPSAPDVRASMDGASMLARRASASEDEAAKVRLHLTTASPLGLFEYLYVAAPLMSPSGRSAPQHSL
jgi:hypothetical protein